MAMDIWFDIKINRSEFEEIAYWRRHSYIKEIVEEVTGETIDNNKENDRFPVNMNHMLQIQFKLLQDINDDDCGDEEGYEYDLRQIAKCLHHLTRHEYIWFGASW